MSSRLLLTNRQWIIFLITILFRGMSLAIGVRFLYLDDLGAGNTLMRLALTVAAISELPVWFFSNHLLER